jgi:hypothetical protein
VAGGKVVAISSDQKLNMILEAIQNLEGRVARIEAGNSASHTGDRTSATTACKKLSIKEFILDRPPATDIQRTLAIGYFLEVHSDMASFTKGDLEKGYRDAKESMPSNISVNIKHCIKNGHMMEAEERKNNKTAYVITRSGEQFVAAGFRKSATDR